MLEGKLKFVLIELNSTENRESRDLIDDVYAEATL